jgi:hypothetical protein
MQGVCLGELELRDGGVFTDAVGGVRVRYADGQLRAGRSGSFDRLGCIGRSVKVRKDVSQICTDAHKQSCCDYNFQILSVL